MTTYALNRPDITAHTAGFHD